MRAARVALGPNDRGASCVAPHYVPPEPGIDCHMDLSPAVIRRASLLSAGIAALVGAGVIAAGVARRSWASVVAYAPAPLQPVPVDAVPPALAPRVVLVVIDGLRLDRSLQMPFLCELRRRGADFESSAGVPSYSRPGRAALATGAWSDLHGATTNFHDRAIAIDNLFREARRAGVTCAVAGSQLWPSLFGSDLAGATVATASGNDDAGQFARRAPELSAFEATIPSRLAAADARLSVTDEVVVDYAGHEFGGATPEYERAVADADAWLRSLFSGLDLAQTAVIVTADHGHLDAGGHGSDEDVVLRTPLVLAGRGIRTGARGTARQIDVAPTIAALLGIPIPAAAEGRVLLDALDLSSEARAALVAEETTQKQRLADAYRATFAGGQGGADLAAMRAARLAGERQSRLPLALALGLGPLLLAGAVALRRRELLVPEIATVILFLVFVSGALIVSGITLSLSTVNHEERLAPYFRTISVASGVAALLAVVLGTAWTRERLHADFWTLSFVGCVSLGLVDALLAVEVARTLWRDGLLMVWRVPDFGPAFVTFVRLVQMQAVGFVAPLVPLVAWAVARPTPSDR